MTMRTRISRGIWGSAALVAAIMATAGLAVAAPAVGDAYTYRLVNGYSGEVRGQLLHEVTQAGSAGVTFSVTPDNAMAGWQHTVVVTPEGNWLRHLVESHGEKIEYEFASAYPAYVFPLDPGKSWSLRVKASVPGQSRSRSVRADAKVLGTERIRVPAGEFDTILIRRFTYPGDAGPELSETRVRETDWYAPTLGRSVRTERRSEYLDFRQCTRAGGCVYYGDWDVYELAAVRPAPAPR